MAKNSPAIPCMHTAAVRRNRPLARRAIVLAAHAQAMLNAPPSFWRYLPDGPAQRQSLARALQELRSVEDVFYSALSDRLSLMVRRQHLDRECWDLLAAARELLKPILGREWSNEWDKLGWFDGSFRIPSSPAGRLRALGCLLEYSNLSPRHKQIFGEAMLADAKKLSRNFAAVLLESDHIRFELCCAAGGINIVARALGNLLNQLQQAFWMVLRAKDPRWLTFPSIGKAPDLTESPGTGQGGAPFSAGRIQAISLPVAVAANDVSCRHSAKWQAQPHRSSSQIAEHGSFEKPHSTGLEKGDEELGKLSVSSVLAWLLPMS